MTTRVFPLLAALRGGATVREMAAAHGVDLKTIRRDLVELRAAGFDLRERVEERGRKVWRVIGLDKTLRRLTSE